VKQRLGMPPRVLIYGPPGVGKTTLVSDADALFVDVEGGSGQLEVARYPFNPGEHDEYRPRDYDQLCRRRRQPDRAPRVRSHRCSRSTPATRSRR
jgi:adenylate kinase